MTIDEQKQHLRDSIKARMARLGEKERHAESRSICRRILESLPQDIAHVAAYFPLNDEADLRPVIVDLLQRNVNVYLPRMEKSLIVYRKIEDLMSLPAGTWNIPEPHPDSPLLLPSDLQAALIPGRAFDRKGNRLGRGVGGYDRWIREHRAANPSAKIWGVALECQIAQDIPCEEHDEKVDAVITARGIEGKK